MRRNSNHTAPLTLVLSVGALAVVGSGCEGCLGIDDYQLVPGAGGGTSTTTATDVPSGCFTDGLLFVSAAADAGPGGDSGSFRCAIPEAIGAGIEIRALDPAIARRECVARARIVAAAGASFESSPRVRFSEGLLAHVAATFRGGALTMPPRCDTGEAMVVDEPPGATDSFVLATLRLTGSTFCTETTHIAYTQDPDGAGKLRVSALEASDDGDLVVTGSLGGTKVVFEEGVYLQEAEGGAFLARYTSSGLFSGVTVRGHGDTDAAMDVAPRDGAWLVTGTVKHEQPACHDCAGTSEVLSPAAAECPSPEGTGGMGGSGGAGGAGGMAGAGGAGGMAGTGGAGGMPGSGGGAPDLDSQNAFLWLQAGAGDTCERFTTFGADGAGTDDAQIGFALSAPDVPGECATFLGGLAGREPWRLDSSSETALFDAGGTTLDAFVARFQGGTAVGCPEGAGPAWTVRLSPISADGSAVVEHVSGTRCLGGSGVVATGLVRASAGSTVSLYRCHADFGCDPNASLVPLAPAAGEHLVVTAFRREGDLDWAATIGPLRADADSAAGSFTARSHHDLTRDTTDNVYVVLSTSGPLSTKNLNRAADCNTFVDNLSPGTYLVALRPQAGSTARCDWAYRID